MSVIEKLAPPQNLTTLAYASIKRYILEGELDEGSRLTEDFFSGQLGISKSPVREALNTLQGEGLIRIEPRRGAYLRRFTIKEVQDLYDVREALEVHAVTAAKVTPELIAWLEGSIIHTKKWLKAGDKLRHIEEDTRFHGAIASASGNRELCRVLANIQNQIWLFRCKTYRLSSTTAPAAHRAILDALRANNTRAAQAAMREHIRLVRNRLIEHLKHI
ncbi:GntR family transcriptional regulator [Alloacidobacterium sp.]|uniref:GntR family transcriptional regulator n=1 Tax=Alloacidobacterium sp. TaxID=2951999 RepID=UPI002D292CA7|nr:GntR family transcriptional regulator [Alloacidobacterium sp.]HYK35763.1 GntR family transcriptional regulator [Alloacidobacterium sp.]